MHFQNAHQNAVACVAGALAYLWSKNPYDQV